MKELSELRATIVAHPWAALGGAFVVGACLAVPGPTGRALRATLGSLVLVTVRAVVGRRLNAAARAWLERVELDRSDAYAGGSAPS